MDLILRNERGEKWRILQADQVAYLYPGRARLPVHGLVIGEHDLPDVVVEGGSHHRRAARKARPIRSLGIPRGMGGRPRPDVAEPTGRPRTRADHPPARRRPLPDDQRQPRLPRLDRGGDPRRHERAVAVRGHHPGPRNAWAGRWAHATAPAPTTRRGCAGSAKKGAHRGREEGRAEAREEARTQGRIEGLAEGRAQLLNVAIRKTLASRGIPADDLTLDARDVARLTNEDVMDALLRCRDAADFRARLRARRRRDE